MRLTCLKQLKAQTWQVIRSINRNIIRRVCGTGVKDVWSKMEENKIIGISLSVEFGINNLKDYLKV